MLLRLISHAVEVQAQAANGLVKEFDTRHEFMFGDARQTDAIGPGFSIVTEADGKTVAEF